MTRQSDLSSPKVMSVMSHVRELQIRLTITVTAILIVATLAYVFRDQLIQLLLSPLGGQQLIYLNPAGGFSFILLVSVYTGLAFAAPIAIHQAYSFISPILSDKSRKNSVFIFISSLILLVAGVIFGYLFAIPGALNFLQTFAGDYIDASLTADSYLNFIASYTLGIGLIFQLPLILMIIHWINPLTPSGLMKSQKWVIVLAFVAAAIITPTPDPINQTAIALPVILVYQLGVVAVLINIYRTRRRDRRLNLIAAKQNSIATVPKAFPIKKPLAKTQPGLTPRAYEPPATAAQTIPPIAKPELRAFKSPSIKTNHFKAVDGFSKSNIGSQRSNQPLSVPSRTKLAHQINSSYSYQKTADKPRYNGTRLSMDGISRTNN